MICLDHVSIETLDRDTGRELVSTKIKISWLSLDGHMQIQYFSVEIQNYPDLLRLLWLFVVFVDFFLDLDQEIMDFYKYLDQDISSQPFLFSFGASKLASKWAKSAGNS